MIVNAPIFRLPTGVRLAVAVLILQVATGCATAGPGSAGRFLRDADRALAGGDAAAARAAYDQALAAAPIGSEAYERALYGAAMTRFADDVEVERATRLLGELAGRPGLVVEWPAVKAVRRARLRQDQLEAERARLAAQVAACHDAGVVASGESRAAAGAAGDEVEVLRSRLRRSQEELATARAELAKTEEALRKVKESLVGGGS